MDKELVKQIEHSYKHSDALVFCVGERVFVSDKVLKHRKEATVEMVEASEVDASCFENNGEYYGDVLPDTYRIILQDPYADNDNTVASIYYDDEIIELRKEN